MIKIEMTFEQQSDKKWLGKAIYNNNEPTANAAIKRMYAATTSGKTYDEYAVVESSPQECYKRLRELIDYHYLGVSDKNDDTLSR